MPPAGTIPAFALVTDAGPVAVGIAIFRVDTTDDDPANPERCIAFCHLDLASWNEALTKEPAYQNTREFCAWCPPWADPYTRPAGSWSATPGTNQSPLARRQPTRPHCRGLTITERVRSAQTQKIFMAYTWLRLRTPINIPWTTHKAGKTMGDIDALSRHQQLQSLPQQLRCTFSRPFALYELFSEIDPAAPPKNVTDHHTSFMASHQRVAAIID